MPLKNPTGHLFGMTTWLFIVHECDTDSFVMWVCPAYVCISTIYDDFGLVSKF